MTHDFRKRRFVGFREETTIERRVFDLAIVALLRDTCLFDNHSGFEIGRQVGQGIAPALVRCGRDNVVIRCRFVTTQSHDATYNLQRRRARENTGCKAK